MIFLAVFFANVSKVNLLARQHNVCKGSNLLHRSTLNKDLSCPDILIFIGLPRIQKKSRLHGSEPEETFTLYVVFEEGFEICIDNPVSAKFSYYTTLTVKGIAHLQLKLPRHTQCRVQKL